jgi:UDP-2,4-diacetamido-2,4,6-trideoxy-beta-L-altropyranose hydrolase
MKVAFRVDASAEIGIGHLMRCLALSEELQRRGHVCSFLLKAAYAEVLQQIKKYKSTAYRIPSKASAQQDLDAVLNYANDNEIDWVITDHYNIDASYVKAIKHQGFHVLSIDDTAQMHYYSDVVVNQNIGAEKLDFSVEPYTTPLLGPSYTMLRDELLIREKKKYNDNVKKIVITLGGTDPDNFLLFILQSLEEIIQDIDILSVIGPFDPHLATLQAYQKQTDLHLKLLQSPRNMAPIYLQADLAISAGGSSCYELAYFGIPSLIIIVAHNQVSIANELDRQHIGISLGRKNEIHHKYLKEKIKELLENRSLQKHLRQNGRKLVDGKGKNRIVDCMETIL